MERNSDAVGSLSSAYEEEGSTIPKPRHGSPIVSIINDRKTIHVPTRGDLSTANGS
jgi:hypothetical protein